jgi:hypothetical protein
MLSAAADGSVALPGGQSALVERLGALEARARALIPAELGAWPGRLALSAIVAGVALVVIFSTAGNSILVPRSGVEFPGWEAGPLSGLFGHLSFPAPTMTLAYSGLLVLMTIAYFVLLLAARALSLRTIVVAVVVVNLVLLLGPPLQLNDVFNYLGYARLGSLHGLNPYTHVMNDELYDPVFRFTSWWNLSSPYGPLFSALTYPLAWLSLPAAYWLLKVGIVAASLGLIWCVVRVARQLGRDPRPALVFVALNPIYLFFAVGGFHNDFLMLLPSTAAISLLLARRDRAAGAVLMLAVAVKLTAIILLPFLLIAARPTERRLRVLTGCVAAAVPLIVLSVALFGFTMPNVADQSGLVTGYSIPNLLGLVLGLGGSTTSLVRLLNVAVVLVVLFGLRRRDWIAASGWATIALIASISWLMPWYIVWALPLAALGSSAALRRTALAFTVFLVLSFAPETGRFLSAHGINPMWTPQGNAAFAYQQHLQH